MRRLNRLCSLWWLGLWQPSYLIHSAALWTLDTNRCRLLLNGKLLIAIRTSKLKLIVHQNELTPLRELTAYVVNKRIEPNACLVRAIVHFAEADDCTAMKWN